MDLYSTSDWRDLRDRAIERDDGRCTVARLLGGPCSAGPLHAHHIVPVSEGGRALDLDNVGTACASHHPKWEALRRELVRRRRVAEEPERVRCPHSHRSPEARAVCERRLARRRSERQLALAV